MVTKVDVGHVLERIKEEAMKLIDKHFYLHVRYDEDEPYRVQRYSMRNVRCQNLMEPMPYDLSCIGMDAVCVLRGYLRHDDIGRKVSISEIDSENRLNDIDVPTTDEEKEIQAIFEKLYELAGIIRGKQAIFILKDDVSNKYQPVVMNISGVEVLTSAIVPGGSFRDPDGGIFVSGIDDIGHAKEQYGEGCFYDLTEAMNAAKKRNADEEMALRLLKQQFISNIPPDELDISTKYFLTKAGFVMVGDLIKLTEKQMSEIYGIGKIRYRKIIKMLESRNLTLRK
jgi:hypothetical protein